jgi:uncharacterized phage-associated protein
MVSPSYNARKAAQEIAYLAMKTRPACLPILKAVKLVYLADRESLERFGFPILDEPHVSMPHGPVNSTTYSHINGEEDLDACGWSAVLQARENHQVAPVQGLSVDDLDELSDADISCLDAVWERFGDMTKWQIREWTHIRENIPEWEDPNGSSRRIPIERILSYLGVQNGDAQAELIEDHRRLDHLFAAQAIRPMR